MGDYVLVMTFISEIRDKFNELVFRFQNMNWWDFKISEKLMRLSYPKFNETKHVPS